MNSSMDVRIDARVSSARLAAGRALEVPQRLTAVINNFVTESMLAQDGRLLYHEIVPLCRSLSDHLSVRGRTISDLQVLDALKREELIPPEFDWGLAAASRQTPIRPLEDRLGEVFKQEVINSLTDELEQVASHADTWRNAQKDTNIIKLFDRFPALAAGFKVLEQFFSGSTFYFVNGDTGDVRFLDHTGVMGDSRARNGLGDLRKENHWKPIGEAAFVLDRFKELMKTEQGQLRTGSHSPTRAVWISNRYDFKSWPLSTTDQEKLVEASGRFNQDREKRSEERELYGVDQVTGTPNASGLTWLIIPIGDGNSILIRANNHARNSEMGFHHDFDDVPGRAPMALEILDAMAKKVSATITRLTDERLLADNVRRGQLLLNFTNGISAPENRPPAFSIPSPWEDRLMKATLDHMVGLFPRIGFPAAPSFACISFWDDATNGLKMVSNLCPHLEAPEGAIIRMFAQTAFEHRARVQASHLGRILGYQYGKLLGWTETPFGFGALQDLVTLGKNILAAPVEAPEHPGIFMVLNPGDRGFINEDGRVLTELARQLGGELIERSRMHRAEAQDDLTRVYKRRALEQIMEQNLEAVYRERISALSVLMIDGDHFKAVNDTYGHQVGDEALKRIALVARRHGGDLVARYGGEEFVVVLPGVDKVQGINAAEDIRMAMEEEKIMVGESDQSFSITLSIGVATVYAAEKVSMAKVIKAADTAMYKAKDDGRNRVVHIDSIEENAWNKRARPFKRPAGK